RRARGGAADDLDVECDLAVRARVDAGLVEAAADRDCLHRRRRQSHGLEGELRIAVAESAAELDDGDALALAEALRRGEVVELGDLVRQMPGNGARRGMMHEPRLGLPPGVD